MRYLRIIDLGLLGGWAGWRQARCAVTGKLQDPVGQLSVRDGEKENLRQRRSSRRSCHFQMRTDDMDMTWELGRWRGGRLWIKGRTNEQESRERGTGDKKRADRTTGQRNRATGDTGGRRRDETRREREKKRGWKGAAQQASRKPAPSRERATTSTSKSTTKKVHQTRRSKRRRQRCQGRYGTYSVYPVAHPRTRLRVTRSKQVVQCVERGARRGCPGKVVLQKICGSFFPIASTPTWFLGFTTKSQPTATSVCGLLLLLVSLLLIV
ncbi:hypothetical protein CCUS01_00886 [Colletotrichum cuscutae]|uniref:Uncharacterized protein n=1 Tax=Colletotrichum cuscutae TaxID=1209917 RepID=A0AAI9V4S1_9PEZI|nr:hypothetical protein CCUS01_00886 [Colletotrichum cuscutae]